jgi:starvation-inducible outer membrane lipoprotein|tara:strand:+ start:174 stop:374 length:201 start_codon:yes stop_codon:yes gene_type:complete
MKKRIVTTLLALSAVALTGCTAGQVPGYIGDPNAPLSPNEAVWNSQNLMQSIDRLGDTLGNMGEGW